MTLSNFTTIPLDQAWYCESCRAVINTPTCHLCASEEHAHRLEAWLTRIDLRPPISLQINGVLITISPTT